MFFILHLIYFRTGITYGRISKKRTQTKKTTKIQSFWRKISTNPGIRSRQPLLHQTQLCQNECCLSHPWVRLSLSHPEPKRQSSCQIHQQVKQTYFSPWWRFTGYAGFEGVNIEVGSQKREPSKREDERGSELAREETDKHTSKPENLRGEKK